MRCWCCEESVKVKLRAAPPPYTLRAATTASVRSPPLLHRSPQGSAEGEEMCVWQSMEHFSYISICHSRLRVSLAGYDVLHSCSYCSLGLHGEYKHLKGRRERSSKPCDGYAEVIRLCKWPLHKHRGLQTQNVL